MISPLESMERMIQELDNQILEQQQHRQHTKQSKPKLRLNQKVKSAKLNYQIWIETE